MVRKNNKKKPAPKKITHVIVDNEPPIEEPQPQLPIADSTMSGGRPGLANLKTDPVYDPRIPYESYTHIHLSSEHADSFLKDASGVITTAGFEVMLDEVIMAKENHDLFLSIATATIPIAWYNVNSSNNVCSFIERVTATVTEYPISITIQTGNYTIQELCTELGTKMTEASVLGLTYTLQYINTTRKTVIRADTSNAVNGDQPHTVTLNFHLPYSVGRILGYDHSDFHTIVVELVPLVTHAFGLLYGTKLVNMRGFTDVFIQTNYSLPNVIHPRTTSRTNSLAKIHISDEKFDSRGIEHFDNTNSDFKSHIMSGRIDLIVVELVDTYGNLIDMNDQDWSLTFLITQRRIW
jgi:hypothetical protein